MHRSNYVFSPSARSAQIADIRRIPEFDSKRDAAHYSTMNYSELETDDDPERFKERLKMISKQKPVEGKSE